MSIKIPQPRVVPGDVVSAENYRMRPPRWEHGQCTRAEYVVRLDGEDRVYGYWSYDVTLTRRTSTGYPLRLSVTDKSVERDS